MKNKYGNRKVTVGGETFDSRREYRRWCELKLLEKVGEIHDLFRQVKFELIPAQYENGKCVERAVNYYADFVYWDGEKMIVEDVKSEATKTDVYIIKRKLMRQNGYVIREVE